MRVNQLSIGMHAEFHRKKFAENSNTDSCADNSGFASRVVARICVWRRAM